MAFESFVVTPIRLRVAELRALKGWTQQQLADAAGLTRVTVVRIESGSNERIELATLEALANALDVDASLLIVHERPRPRKGK